MADVLKYTNLSPSSYYYKKKNGKKGRKPSSVTAIAEETVDNKVVVEDITELLSKEFVDYGYIKVSKYLKQNNYNINKKKVYRLMKENNLLHKQRIKPKSGRQFVKFRKVTVDKPFSFMEMDIKYVHIKGLHINVFLLTVLDVFLRMALGYIVKPSVTKKDTVDLLDSVISKYYIEGAVIRNDNGSQFIAGYTRDYLKKKGLYQEFTHVSTPEKNGHIESFHSIIQNELFSKYEFDSMEELQEVLKRYYDFYNKERIHSSIKYKSPETFLKEYLNNNPPALNYDLKRQQSMVQGLATISSDNDAAEAALEPCGLPFIIA